ncbi:MAG: hypothetical protein HOP18_16340 [Deltaproteobacteria bacterium]|nr:hypothetical protein [Deltaproteobacteria bacterium]
MGKFVEPDVARNQQEPQARKPYTPPQMIEYGQIAKLTRGASGTVGDGVGAMQMIACL